MKKACVCFVALLMLTNCAYDEHGNVKKSSVGAIGGGVLGAVAGSAIGKGSGKSVAIATGAILGSMAGSAIGRSLDQEDLRRQQQAQMNALEYKPDGSASKWKNPNTKASGSITPTETTFNGDQPCREYSQTITVGGKQETAYGKACRKADGSWDIVK